MLESAQLETRPTDLSGMGLVMVKVKLANLQDVWRAASGAIPEAAIRRVEFEALADTGAIGLAIPAEVAAALGAEVLRRRPVRVADGRLLDVSAVGPLEIVVLGRDMVGDAIVLPYGTTPLLGAIQLEYLDLVVVPATGEVIPNPAHPDGPILPMLRAS